MKIQKLKIHNETEETLWVEIKTNPSIILCIVYRANYTDLLTENEKAENAVLGDILALVAMMFFAGQLTYEEKFVKKYNIKPMNAIGLEGSFSFIILSSMLVAFYFIKVPFDMNQPNGVIEDAIDGFLQLGNNSTLIISFIGKSTLK